MVLSDDFIDSVITPKPQSRDEAKMNREFHGMMAVQHSAETEDSEQNGGDE